MSKNEEGASGRRPRGAPDADVAQDRQRIVGEQLRRLFDDIVDEQVPDEFLELLEKADKRALDEGEGQDGDDKEATRGDSTRKDPTRETGGD